MDGGVVSPAPDMGTHREEQVMVATGIFVAGSAYVSIFGVKIHDRRRKKSPPKFAFFDGEVYT